LSESFISFHIIVGKFSLNWLDIRERSLGHTMSIPQAGYENPACDSDEL